MQAIMFKASRTGLKHVGRVVARRSRVIQQEFAYCLLASSHSRPSGSAVLVSTALLLHIYLGSFYAAHMLMAASVMVATAGLIAHQWRPMPESQETIRNSCN